jgi:hypothetical protein
MDLGDAGGSERLAIEGGEKLVDVFAELPFDDLPDLVEGDLRRCIEDRGKGGPVRFG